MKVAHHESEFSTLTNFLRNTKPDYAVISCGEGNSYGHSHAELLKRLKRIGCSIWITKDSGAILLETDGKRMKLGGWK